ncbi:MAG TPA: HI0074 family nucleotidyltransferase substrate-binding subunit [Alphaproteobacteria bacterium]|nr:HI0074 family nucleotidyltransferase substrate-binding subunit [Alphaproteobacteria bacterium]
MNITNYNFFQKLENLPFVEKIWLYGSRARGDFKDRSDIDIAIECPQATILDWYKVVDIIEDADTLLKIDCVRWEELTDGSLFVKHILKDRKLIFQKQSLLKEEIIALQDSGDEKVKSRPDQNFEDLGRALERLNEILQKPLDEHRYIIDATIQRFEFCIELFWKNLKNFVQMEEREVLSPRHAVSQAYQMKWIDNEKLWIDMLRDRNVLSHDYNEGKADGVYARIKTYYPEMQAVYEKLRKMYINNIKDYLSA